MRRQKLEIESEIKALKALKPVGPFQKKTARSIEFAIEELQHGFDDTAGEWDELTDEQRDIVLAARQWKQGDSSEKISEGWDGLVA